MIINHVVLNGAHIWTALCVMLTETVIYNTSTIDPIRC